MARITAVKSKTTIVSTIPELPSELTDGSYMFSGCSNLTGTVPTMPSSLTSYTDMFYGRPLPTMGLGRMMCSNQNKSSKPLG